MKSTYSLVALLIATLVNAGPLPRVNGLNVQNDKIKHAPLQARTEHAMNSAPVSPSTLGEVDVEAEKQRLAEAKAGEISSANLIQTVTNGCIAAETKAAADKMEAEHVAKAEAEAKAHQEGALMILSHLHA
jgi:hypothetical protein